MIKILLALSLLSLLSACTEKRIPIPKPRVYPKVTYPERVYQDFDQTYCNFTFEYPTYMTFERDTLLINQRAKHPCWFMLHLPALNGSVHFTYTDIGGSDAESNLFKVIKDSYTLTEKHNIKATGREEQPFVRAEEGIYGITYRVDGDVASPFHFIVTDSLEHAVWASLYFNSMPDADSMAPIVDYVQEDLAHILETFRWNNQGKEE